MADQTPPRSEIIFYQTEDGRTRIQCRFENETIWLTQALIAELFQTTPQNVTLHLKAIYEEGEVVETATCKDYLQVRIEGGREIRRTLRHCSLPAILDVLSVVSGGYCRKPRRKPRKSANVVHSSTIAWSAQTTMRHPLASFRSKA